MNNINPIQLKTWTNGCQYRIKIKRIKIVLKIILDILSLELGYFFGYRPNMMMINLDCLFRCWCWWRRRKSSSGEKIDWKSLDLQSR